MADGTALLHAEPPARSDMHRRVALNPTEPDSTFATAIVEVPSNAAQSCDYPPTVIVEAACLSCGRPVSFDTDGEEREFRAGYGLMDVGTCTACGLQHLREVDAPNRVVLDEVSAAGHQQRRHDAHERAAQTHDRAAELHDSAAETFDMHARGESAQREREMAESERRRAETARERAEDELNR